MNIPNLSQIIMNFPISARTASRELEELYKKGVIEKKGKGPAVYFLKNITRQIYGQINSIGDTYAKKELKELIDKKIVKRIGKGKDTYYILVTE